MALSYRHHSNKWIVSEIILGVVFLSCGCAIYLLFRNKTLNLYQWCSTLGLSNTIDTLRSGVQSWNLYEFIKYSLPDGLYCAAYIFMIDAIWHNDKGIIKEFIITLMPIITISSEIFQYFGLVKGTFDVYDLICYVIPPLVYLSIKTINSNMFNSLKHTIA